MDLILDTRERTLEEIGEADQSEFLDSRTFFNKTFSDVYFGGFPENIWYNKKFGIVAFKDLDNTLWQFERFE